MRVEFLMAGLFLIPAVPPLLARSWRGLAFMTVVPAVFVGYLMWSADRTTHDVGRALAQAAALIASMGFLVGAGVAALRVAGLRRGWQAAHFPIPEVLVALFATIVLVLLTLRGL